MSLRMPLCGEFSGEEKKSFRRSKKRSTVRPMMMRASEMTAVKERRAMLRIMTRGMRRMACTKRRVLVGI